MSPSAARRAPSLVPAAGAAGEAAPVPPHQDRAGHTVLHRPARSKDVDAQAALLVAVRHARPPAPSPAFEAASYTGLATRADTTALTARRRLEALVGGQVLRLATEVDLARLGIRTEALLWITVAPGGLEETGQELSRHPQVRFASAVTGPANLLVAVAAVDLNALYHFMSGTLGSLEYISTVEVTPILTGVKRTGRSARAASEPNTSGRGAAVAHNDARPTSRWRDVATRGPASRCSRRNCRNRLATASPIQGFDNVADSWTADTNKPCP